MDIIPVLIIVAGALAGGFVSGLAGFGTGITAVGFFLFAVPPSVAGAMVIVCSVVAQSQTLPGIWRSIRPRLVLPFILPGLIGSLAGTELLAHLDPRTVKLGIGALLLVFSAQILARSVGRRRSSGSAWGGRAADAVVGFGGGVLGGMVGLSGPLPTMWASVRGWSKAESRGLFQAYNFSILLAALLTRAASGLLTAEVGRALMVALPGTIAGAWIGAHTYRRLSDQHFQQAMMALLAVSGLVLVWSNL